MAFQETKTLGFIVAPAMVPFHLTRRATTVPACGTSFARFRVADRTLNAPHTRAEAFHVLLDLAAMRS